MHVPCEVCMVCVQWRRILLCSCEFSEALCIHYILIFNSVLVVLWSETVQRCQISPGPPHLTSSHPQYQRLVNHILYLKKKKNQPSCRAVYSQSPWDSAQVVAPAACPASHTGASCSAVRKGRLTVSEGVETSLALREFLTDVIRGGGKRREREQHAHQMTPVLWPWAHRGGYCLMVCWVEKSSIFQITFSVFLFLSYSFLAVEYHFLPLAIFS